ncbi:MAG: hypothetical protein Q8P84_08130, partial [Deltaproteobacteria bacterium]|nr:hypothetical protein [Deltaproteobacteria bacterium]
MSQTPADKKPRIHPDIRDIWLVARVIQMTIGFNLGLYLFIYGVFFYEAFGGDINPNALHLTAVVFMVGNIVMVLSNIPTGALADFMGRKKTVILSFCFRAIFFFLMAWIVFVPSITWAFVLGALAYAFFGIG